MDWKISLGLVARHLLTSIGGSLAAKGFIESSDVEPAAGAVLIIAGLIWSVIQKRKAVK